MGNAQVTGTWLLLLHTFYCGNTYITWNLPSLSLVCCLVFFFWDKILLDIKDWPETHGSPASTSQGPALQACAIILGPAFVFILRNATPWHELHFHRWISTTTSHRNSLNFTKMKFCILPPGLWDHFSILYLWIFSSFLREMWWQDIYLILISWASTLKVPMWCSVRIPFPMRMDAIICPWRILLTHPLVAGNLQYPQFSCGEFYKDECPNTSWAPWLQLLRACC